MDNSIIVGMVKTFTLAVPGLLVVCLGMWLSTKNWAFYSIVVVGSAWIAWVISGPVYDIWINPEVATSVKVIAWTIPPIFFTVLNIGTISTIRAIRRGREEGEMRRGNAN